MTERGHSDLIRFAGMSGLACFSALSAWLRPGRGRTPRLCWAGAGAVPLLAGTAPAWRRARSNPNHAGDDD